MNMRGIAVVMVVVSMVFPYSTTAQETNQNDIRVLEESIRNRQEERRALEEEAQRLREELENVGSQRSSLSQELSLIAQERKSLENQIAQTTNEIGTLSLGIQQSQNLIDEYNSQIINQSRNLASVVRRISQLDSMSFLEQLLSSQELFDLLRLRQDLMRLQDPLVQLTYDLKENKERVYVNALELEQQQSSLSQEQQILDDQKVIVQEQEQKKDEILQETRNKENIYQENLKQTLATISELDQEIRTYESTLEFLLDPQSLPDKGSEVFAWPLEYVLITQRFGKTVSSERLYVSGSHSGVDFRAATGTPVYAVADGIVRGIGDTDQTCPRASFGKWVFIEHTNLGLSTTSAHLSRMSVSEGQTVRKGDLIGYSGNTGRSTAPHLHLTVYATEGFGGENGVRITNRPSNACVGQTYRMPLAPTAAYLDPLDFLPSASISMFKHPSVAL